MQYRIFQRSLVLFSFLSLVGACASPVEKDESPLSFVGGIPMTGELIYKP